MNSKTKPEIFGELLENTISALIIYPSPESPYWKVSEEILEMAVAYRRDGLSFADRGDLVNAHAAFSYGFGWLDFGILSGLFSGEKPVKRVPLFDENMPDVLFPHLFEKTNRYKHMLSEAVISVSPAPDIESPLYSFSKSVLNCAENYLNSGEKYNSCENFVNALAYFSYGYGILDAAVRSGLFIIVKNRSLFTV